MIEKIIHRIGKFNKVAGLEVEQTEPGGYVYTLCILSLKGKKAKIDSCQVGVRDIQQIVSIVGKLPVSLVYNGYNVLIKSSVKGAKLESIFPSAQSDDLVLTSSTINNYALHSLVRKKDLLAIEENLHAAGLNIIRISAGPQEAFEYLPLIGIKSNAIEFGNHTFSNVSTDFFDYQYSKNSIDKVIDIGDEQVSSMAILSFCAALSVLRQSQNLITPLLENIENRKNDTLYNSVFKTVGWTYMIGLLIILLINFILFIKEDAQNKELSARIGLFSGKYDELNLIKKDIEQKEGYLRRTGWMDEGRSSFYADRIAKSIPSGLNLSLMSINPVDQAETDKNKTLIFNSGMIRLEGNVITPLDLNEFNHNLQQNKWVISSKISDYQYDATLKRGKFKIDLIYNPLL